MSALSRPALHNGLGGVTALALGILVMAGISGLTWFSDSGVVGPAAVPGTCGVLLLVIGAVQLAGAFRARHDLPVDDSTTEVRMERQENSAEQPNGRLAWLAWAGVLMTALAIPYLGMLTALALATVFLLKLVSKKSWLVTLVYTVSLVAAVYAVFVVILGIPLPTSPWFGW